MYEHRSEDLLPRPLFARRVVVHATLAIGITAAALAIGIAGYHYIAGFSWTNAFLNASMILGGMGQVDE